MFALCRVQTQTSGGLLQWEHPEILAQNDRYRNGHNGEPIGNHHRSFEWCQVPSLTPYDHPFPQYGGSICPQDTQMAIFPQRVNSICFQGRRIKWRYFRLHQIQLGGRPPSWIISNGHISATAHSIHLYCAHRAVIFALASGVTMGWLLRLVTGGPTGKGPPTVPEFLMINFNVCCLCLLLLSNKCKQESCALCYRKKTARCAL